MKEGGKRIWNLPVSIAVVPQGSIVSMSELRARLYCGRGTALTRDRVAMMESR